VQDMLAKHYARVAAEAADREEIYRLKAEDLAQRGAAIAELERGHAKAVRLLGEADRAVKDIMAKVDAITKRAKLNNRSRPAGVAWGK
jgi:hypothetical protein